MIHNNAIIVGTGIKKPHSHNRLTTWVPDVDLRYATALSIDVIAPIEQSHCSLHEAHLTGQVQRSIAITITHQRVGIGL